MKIRSLPPTSGGPHSRRSRALAVALALALAWLGGAGPVGADTTEWTGGDLSSTSWHSAFNWSGPVPTAATTATFPGTIPPSARLPRVLSTAAADGLIFTGSGYVLTLNASLTIGTGGITGTTANAPSVSVVNQLVLGASSTVGQLNGNANGIVTPHLVPVTLTMVRSGGSYAGLLRNEPTPPNALSLTIGDGTNAASQTLASLLTLSPNSYSGPTLVRPNATLTIATTVSISANSDYTVDGTLALTANGTLKSLNGAASGVVNLGAQALTVLGSGTFAGQILGVGSFSKSGPGTVSLTGTNTYTGITSVLAGTLRLSAANASTAHAITAGAVLEIDVASGSRDGVSTTFSGGGTLRKTGAGALAWSTSAATFALGSGALIDVQGGHVTGGSFSNEDWTANLADLQVAAGASFGGVEANVRVNALSGAGLIQSGFNGGGYDRFTFGVAHGSGTFSGVLSDNAALPAKYEKAGSGTQILLGASAYTGGTVISGGTLQIGNGGTTGSIAGAVENSGALAFRRSDIVAFAGSVSGPGTLSQSGGTLTLSAVSPATGVLAVQAGRVVLSGSWAGALYVSASARFSLAGGGSLSSAGASSVIDAGGLVDGAGSLLGSVANAGTIVASGAGQTLTFSGGTLTNAAGGVLRAIGGGTLNLADAGSLVNQGLIDSISGQIVLPASFTNNGILLDRSLVRVKSATRVGNAVTVRVDSHSAHIYQLQRSLDLSTATFMDLGAPQAGNTGSELVFTDPAASGAQGFYRVAVD